MVTQRLTCVTRTPGCLSIVRTRSVRCRSAGGGFGGEGEGNQTATGGGKKKKGKRGKVSSRPSPKEQLKQLQEDERLYREQMEQKYASSSNAVPREEQVVESMNDTVPEQITNRMLKRIALFSGGPIVFGMLLFPLFYYIKKVQDVDLPVWAVYIVQTGVFGGGLLGISYGIISASWDPQREGSLLGWNEFQANLPLVLNRFGKKK